LCRGGWRGGRTVGVFVSLDALGMGNWMEGWDGRRDTYSELPTPPNSFHNAELVECQDGEEYFG